ncbi:polymer-forming cytoskeletal protein [Escherichia coli]|nr:polymer-forming cytoskeletal protein [Escherichia coli]
MLPAITVRLKLYAINFALFSWGLALTGKIINNIILAEVATFLTITGLIFHIWINKNNIMFKSKKTVSTNILQPEEIPPTTIIANGVYIEGNINSSEDSVHISGRLKGNISAENGEVRILSNGIVEGEIKCNSLIVNGSFSGQCTCQSLEIEENGEITGTISYIHLTIKKGGLFSGHAIHSNENKLAIVHNITSSTHENAK